MRKRILLTISLFVVVFLSGFSVTANASFVTLTGTITDSSAGGNYLPLVVVTAYPTISCGSWTGTTGVTNLVGRYIMSVPDDCDFYIHPTKKNYTFDPVYYLVIPEKVDEEFDFVATFE